MAERASVRISLQDLESTVSRMLSPFLGETMARASVIGHRDRLGIGGPEVNGDQVRALMEKIRAGLNVFVGREKSAGIVEEIVKALEQRGAAS